MVVTFQRRQNVRQIFNLVKTNVDNRAGNLRNMPQRLDFAFFFLKLFNLFDILLVIALNLADCLFLLNNVSRRILFVSCGGSSGGSLCRRFSDCFFLRFHRRFFGSFFFNHHYLLTDRLTDNNFFIFTGRQLSEPAIKLTLQSLGTGNDLNQLRRNRRLADTVVTQRQP